MRLTALSEFALWFGSVLATAGTVAIATRQAAEFDTVVTIAGGTITVVGIVGRAWCRRRLLRIGVEEVTVRVKQPDVKALRKPNIALERKAGEQPIPQENTDCTVFRTVNIQA